MLIVTNDLSVSLTSWLILTTWIILGEVSRSSLSHTRIKNTFCRLRPRDRYGHRTNLPDGTLRAYDLLQKISLCIVKLHLSSNRLAARLDFSSSTCREFFISPLAFSSVYRTAGPHFHQISSWHKMEHVTEPMDQHKVWYTVLLLSEQELGSDLAVYGIAWMLPFIPTY